LRWLRREQPDLEQACRSAEAIVKDEVRAADIIDRLRTLYKKTPPQRQSVDVDEIIGEMLLLLRSEANEYAVSIRTDLAADFPKIAGDRVQLQQVLMNLMLNGIEAMKGAGGVLTVKTGRGEGGQVLISVSDTGVGLPDGGADEIFNAFFTTKPEGSSMGLAISRSIVESHDGHLWPHPTTDEARRFISPCRPQSWKCRQNVRFGAPRPTIFSLESTLKFRRYKMGHLASLRATGYSRTEIG
jgi:signal transduction histidine kinase